MKAKRQRGTAGPISLLTGRKRCRVCGHDWPLGFFPIDRSRPDGRWHTCSACNKNHWREHGKQRALGRKLQVKLEQARTSRTGLSGLRKYHTADGLFDSLPVELRLKAQMILSNSLARARAEGRKLSQPQIALRIAAAVSNCVRVGDRSWARRMWRLKGYRRAERRKAEKEATQAEIRARNERGPTRHKVIPWW
jgi:hypothetical protein